MNRIAKALTIINHQIHNYFQIIIITITIIINIKIIIIIKSSYLKITSVTIIITAIIIKKLKDETPFIIIDNANLDFLHKFLVKH